MIVGMSGEDADRYRQMHDVAAHELNRLIEELGEDQLRVLCMMIDSIAISQEPIRTAAYLSGRITQAQQHRFGICAACDKNHDKELLGDDHQPIPPSANAPEPPPNVAVRRSLPVVEEMPFTPIGSKLPLALHESKLMAEYGLDDLRDAETDQLIGFICKNCEKKYVSIADRMLEPPGVKGCDGCQHKAKWG
jgi:hypothetical protein